MKTQLAYSASCPPGAHRIVDGAKRVLAERGYSGLTLEALAAESGTNKAMISYYFGSKAGLESALIEDINRDEIRRLGNMAPGIMRADDRVAALVAAARVLVENTDLGCRFDILPHAMRNEELGELMVPLWSWYRKVFVRCLGGPGADQNNPDLQALASLFVAVLHGLAIQARLRDPDGDPDRTWETLERALKLHIDSLEDSKTLSSAR